jgi:PKD repeat protein
MLMTRYVNRIRLFTCVAVILLLVSPCVLPLVNPTIAFAANPDQPANVVPINGATNVPLLLTLQSTALSDGDTDTHLASRWQISTTSGNYASPVYDSFFDTSNLDTLDIPLGVLQAGTVYYWHVMHIDERYEQSVWSAETSFTTTAVSGAPNKPINTAPVSGATDVALTPTLVPSAFSDPDVGDTHDFSQWQISTDDAASFVSNIIYDSSPTSEDLDTLPISEGLLANNTTYHWRVRYQDSFGNWSAWSDETSLTTITWHKPDKPTNLAPVNNGVDIVLTPTLISSIFHDADTADTHIASRWQMASETIFTTIVFDSNVDTENLTEIEIPSGFLEYDETYYWRVRYQDSTSQWSAWSNESSFSALTTTAPARPTNLVPAAAATNVSIRPTLSSSDFDDPDEDDSHTASQWQITDTSGDYSEDAIIYDSGVDITDLTSDVISVLLEYSTIYYWHVRYKDSHDNWSTYSPETQFSTVASAKPSQPVVSSPVTGTTVSSLTPTITASDFLDSDIGDTHEASKWQISTTAGEYATPLYDSGEDTTNLTSITIPVDELSSDITYYLRVSYLDNFDNWSDWSAEISFKTVGATASFLVVPTNVAANEEITFSDTSSGNVTAWKWVFGDGTSIDWTTENRPANGQIKHAYTTEGIYTVSLQITSPGGTDTKTLADAITIGGGGSAMNTTWIIVGTVAAIAALGGGFYYVRKRREA